MKKMGKYHNWRKLTGTSWRKAHRNQLEKAHRNTWRKLTGPVGESYRNQLEKAHRNMYISNIAGTDNMGIGWVTYITRIA